MRILACSPPCVLSGSILRLQRCFLAKSHRLDGAAAGPRREPLDKSADSAPHSFPPCSCPRSTCDLSVRSTGGEATRQKPRQTEEDDPREGIALAHRCALCVRSLRAGGGVWLRSVLPRVLCPPVCIAGPTHRHAVARFQPSVWASRGPGSPFLAAAAAADRPPRLPRCRHLPSCPSCSPLIHRRLDQRRTEADESAADPNVRTPPRQRPSRVERDTHTRTNTDLRDRGELINTPLTDRSRWWLLGRLQLQQNPSSYLSPLPRLFNDERLRRISGRSHPSGGGRTGGRGRTPFSITLSIRISIIVVVGERWSRAWTCGDAVCRGRCHRRRGCCCRG